MLRQPGVVEMALAWLLGILLYPGLLFGMALALSGEWLSSAGGPLFARRLYRARSRPRHFLQPAYDTVKLAARRPLGSTHYALRITQLLAPILALALLPIPGSPIMGVTGPVGDVLVVLALLAVQPLCAALVRLGASDPAKSLQAAQNLGAMLTGLFPLLIAVAALVQAAGGHSLLLADLTAAPETGIQALVRLLAAATLLVSLPLWLDSGRQAGAESAEEHVGGLLQRSALSALWSVLVLPMPGDLLWALFVVIAGALFAYVAMRLLQARLAPAARRATTARLILTATLPVAALALLVAFVS